VAQHPGVENIKNVNKALQKAHSWHEKVDQHATLHEPSTPSDLPSRQTPFGRNDKERRVGGALTV
jgi:hypothetical protein